MYLDLHSESNVIGVVRRATTKRKYTTLENYECSPIHYNSVSNVISGSTPSSTSTPCGTTSENSPDSPNKQMTFKRPRGQKARSKQSVKAKEPREHLMIAEIHNQCDQFDQRSDSDPDEETIYYC